VALIALGSCTLVNEQTNSICHSGPARAAVTRLGLAVFRTSKACCNTRCGNNRRTCTCSKRFPKRQPRRLHMACAAEADDEETMAVLQRSLSQRHVSDGRQEGFNALLNS